MTSDVRYQCSVRPRIVIDLINTIIIILVCLFPAVMKFSGLLLALVVLAVCGDIAHVSARST